MSHFLLLQEIASTHHLLSLSVLFEGETHSASLFYAFYLSDKQPIFITASPENTLHVQAALIHPKVSGTIAKATQEVQYIQGIQFTGIWKKACSKEEEIYFAKFPYALKLSPPIWSIHLLTVKITDNKILGFGNKALLDFK